MKKFLLGFGLAAALVSCSDDEAGVEDPMANAPGADATAPAVPGMGDVGGGMGGMIPNAGDLQNAAQKAAEEAAKVVEGEQQAQNNNLQASARYVRTYYLFVRSCPGMQCKPVDSLPFNAEIHITDVSKKGHWVKIAENKWLGARYLSKTPNQKPFVPKGGH